MYDSAALASYKSCKSHVLSNTWHTTRCTKKPDNHLLRTSAAFLLRYAAS